MGGWTYERTDRTEAVPRGGGRTVEGEAAARGVGEDPDPSLATRPHDDRSRGSADELRGCRPRGGRTRLAGDVRRGAEVAALEVRPEDRECRGARDLSVQGREGGDAGTREERRVRRAQRRTPRQVDRALVAARQRARRVEGRGKGSHSEHVPARDVLVERRGVLENVLKQIAVIQIVKKSYSGY